MTVERLKGHSEPLKHRTPFVKMHGAGNDFVVMDGRHRLPWDFSKLAQALCDRHLGVGADGLIVLEPSRSADFAMRYFNADGGRAVCGNGMRCLARFIYSLRAVPPEQRHFEIETDDRIVAVEVIGKGERVRIDMGEPEFEGSKIPTAEAGEQIGVGLVVDGKSYTITAVSMGNPHCVIFVDDCDSLDLSSIGPKFCHHPFFPKQTNVEFVQIVDRSLVKMRVWERGVGETLACGTGSCAVLAAGVRLNSLERTITLLSRGGEFRISWNESTNRIQLVGPTEEVFVGEIDIDALLAGRAI